MDPKKVAATLHPLERKVLPALARNHTVDALMAATGLKDVEVVRALQWLENKRLATVALEPHELVQLDVNGRAYQKKGLPERQFLRTLGAKELSLEHLVKKSGLTREELNACIGVLRAQGLILLRKEKDLLIKLTPLGVQASAKQLPAETFLAKQFPMTVVSLSKDERAVLDQLKKRKRLVTTELRKEKLAKLTPEGERLVKAGVGDVNVIETLTPELLRTGQWRNKQFRRYDVTAVVPKIGGGRRHFVNDAVRHIRGIWRDMGFREITGTMVQPAFWDLDALYVPQDHPARELQDTFFLKDPHKAVLPKALVARIKATHEHGGTTGSTGWRHPWSESKASELLLRTHDTVLSAIALAGLKESDLPVKLFNVSKVFRNETPDWKHLFEFYQVGGIVVDPRANLRHLYGYLKEFFRKMGFKDVRLRPSHFPYTEPSLEVDVLHPVRNEWVELGGAGIFRPEVVQPLLGAPVPVLAWGIGLERIITDYYKITDLREIYRNDIERLRAAALWVP